MLFSYLIASKYVCNVNLKIAYISDTAYTPINYHLQIILQSIFTVDLIMKGLVARKLKSTDNRRYEFD